LASHAAVVPEIHALLGYLVAAFTSPIEVDGALPQSAGASNSSVYFCAGKLFRLFQKPFTHIG
jgi:hypothetical protein